MNLINVTRKIEGLYRLAKVYFQPTNMIVAEYPKSGGTWFSNMISEYFGLPFPRNKIPKLQSCIMHGHYRYFPTMKNVFVVLRDGRDVMVSFYFHSFFQDEIVNHAHLKRMRRVLPFKDVSDIENNLPKFIEYKFIKKRPPRFTWSEFVESWIDKDVALVKYENLLQNTVKEVEQAIKKICNQEPDYVRIQQIAEKHSFKSQSERSPGQENRSSFLRKGIAGDWKNYFNREARAVFNYYAGDQLIKLGYEKDQSWV